MRRERLRPLLSGCRDSACRVGTRGHKKERTAAGIFANYQRLEGQTRDVARLCEYTRFRIQILLRSPWWLWSSTLVPALSTTSSCSQRASMMAERPLATISTPPFAVTLRSNGESVSHMNRSRSATSGRPTGKTSPRASMCRWKGVRQENGPLYIRQRVPSGAMRTSMRGALGVMAPRRGTRSRRYRVRSGRPASMGPDRSGSH